MKMLLLAFLLERISSVFYRCRAYD